MGWLRRGFDWRRRRGEPLALLPIARYGDGGEGERAALSIQIIRTPSLHRGVDSITVTFDPEVVEALRRIAAALEEARQ